jgi:hypothetical protein
MGLYGDFTVIKDRRSSAFIEVIYVGMMQSEVGEFLQVANAELSDLGTFSKFEDAKRFVATAEQKELPLAGD